MNSGGEVQLTRFPIATKASLVTVAAHPYNGSASSVEELVRAGVHLGIFSLPCVALGLLDLLLNLVVLGLRGAELLLVVLIF